MKKTTGAIVTLGVIVMGGLLIRSPSVRADDDDLEQRFRSVFG